MRALKLTIVLVAAVSISCGQVTFRKSGRPCTATGDCADGFECRPDANVCVPALTRNCTGTGICWSDVVAGDTCLVEESFLQCGEDNDCSDGCRTCTGGVWTPCEFYDCVLGTIEHCAFCGNDCEQTVLNADPLCNAFNSECDYVACFSPALDADGDRTNGCECIATGVETCNGVDEDCNGAVDDMTVGAIQTECDALYPSVNVASWACDAGCAVGTCEADFVDLDGVVSNGCEVNCVPSGVETCDGIDNDCDGDIDLADADLDEAIEIQVDCAGQYPLATNVDEWSCVSDACDIVTCDTDYFNRDDDLATGCDYLCVFSGAEVCDGDDNDCNGSVDDLTTGQVQTECDALYPNVNVQFWECIDECLVQTCDAGFSDFDGFGFNGCEDDCVLTNGGVETCDGIDNDCNDIVDDVIDIGSDCGAQNPSAVNVNAWACVVDTCDIAACVVGFSDLTGGVADGCESVCTPTGAEVCNDLDDDCNGDIDDILQVDLNNECAVVFPLAAAVTNWECINGACDVLDCQANAHDENGVASDGCEYACVITGVETCDNSDNDCDGDTDTADSDLDQQVEINADCLGQYPPGTNATSWSCTAGACDIAACATNFYHVDTNLNNGCEYNCISSGAEICDNDDNDCDGDVDTADSDLDEQSEIDAACAIQHAPGTDVTAWDCAVGACGIVTCATDTHHNDTSLENGCEYGCTASGAETCDGSDNDCDGDVDLLDTDLDTQGEVDADCAGQYPSALSVDAWECAASACGIQACVADNYNYDTILTNGCEYACAVTGGGTEVCDYADNDCNGTIDDSLSNCRCVDGVLPPLGAEVCWDGTDDDCNDAVDDNCGCGPSFTFTVTSETIACGGGDTDVPLVHLRLDTDCDNELTSLTVRRHAASTTTDGELSNIRLYQDVDNSGDFSTGDLLLDTVANMSSGVATFTGFTLPVASGSPVYVVVVGNSSGTSYFAAEINGTADFGLSDTSQSLSMPIPIESGTQSLTGALCAALDGGAGSQGAVSAEQVTGGTGWTSGAGSEAGWSAAAQQTVAISDCDAQSPDSELLGTTDGGSASEFIHIDTGVPLGLPNMCTLSMRVYGSLFRASQGGRCDRELLGDHAEVRLYSYSGANTVAAGSLEQVATSNGTTVGPNTAGCISESAPAPHTDYFDFDLTTLYDNASGTSTLEVRFIPEETGNINTADGHRINAISEIYMQVRP